MALEKLSISTRPLRRPVSVIITAASLLIGASAFASIGTISAVSGAAYHKARGADKWSIAGRDAPLEPGDRVKTGPDGRVVLAFEDNTKLSLGNETEIEITEFLLKKRKRSAVYTMSTGKMRAIVNKFSGTTDIKVKTATSVSGVKGTDFIVMNEGQANVVFGEESTVRVSGSNGGAVDVGRGAMTENTKGSPPIKPVKVEKGSLLEEARTQLEAITGIERPVEWEKAGRLPEILARWNINYGHYLADSRKFEDSLGVFLVAIDLTGNPSIKAEAHLERGTVFSRNLNEPRLALDEYMAVVEQYPETAFTENAVFSAGMIHMELGENDKARVLFERYLIDYPQGGHRDTVEQFIRGMEKE